MREDIEYDITKCLLNRGEEIMNLFSTTRESLKDLYDNYDIHFIKNKKELFKMFKKTLRIFYEKLKKLLDWNLKSNIDCTLNYTFMYSCEPRTKQQLKYINRVFKYFMTRGIHSHKTIKTIIKQLQDVLLYIK